MTIEHSLTKVELTVQDIGDYLGQDNPIPVQIWQQWFEMWINTLSDILPEAIAYELTLRLTNDAEIEQLNAQYRHKNQPTDVLAFAALEVQCPSSPEFATVEPLYLGDIIISLDTASQQAHQQGHSLTQELAWLGTHGLLHLLGWDHPDETSLVAMLTQQETLLQQVGLMA